jgi:predicted ATPase/class 3 adenylate cyclase
MADGSLHRGIAVRARTANQLLESRTMGLPTGPAVTFMFTDIEGSTRLEREVGSVAWSHIVARHDGLLRIAIEGHGGMVVKTEGDAFFAAFASPQDALAAAASGQRALAGEPWADGLTLRVRMGLHLGEGRLRHARGTNDPEDYVGIDVNYAARIAAAGNGGQIVLSDALARSIGSAFGDVDALRGATLADEGLRAVKDFEEPARLHRLVVPGAADDTRALRTIDAPSNLPGDVTTLVGRDDDVALLGEVAKTNRIVTLTGPGGSGKTRLALQVARTIRDRFPHGVWFVDLAAVRDAELLESAIADALGVRESSERDVAAVLRGHLRDRVLLLVLDNLEQLLPAGADIVSRLVKAAPELRVIVTSRELLRIAGERGYPVPPLDLAAGAALFEDRARGHRPDMVFDDATRATIREISERLGGLPLAIELAAARIRMLNFTVILERLGHSLDLGGGARDVPERQRTLRGAIAWSHDLLSDPERRLFRRLAVFAGGLTAGAAFAVADPDGDLGIDVVDGLESLADKSLIRLDAPGAGGGAGEAELRFDLHPLLREYALERLDESGERQETERRHAAVVLALTEEVGRVVLSPTGDTSLRRLDPEEHNIRAAIAWSVDQGDPGVGLRIMGSIWRWFQHRGRLREGRALLAQLFAASDRIDNRTRIGGLSADGGLAYWLDDFDAARTAYEERLRLATGTGDAGLMADAHYDLGFLSMVAQDGEALRRHEGQAYELYTGVGDVDGAIRARQALVLAEFLAGSYVQARDLEELNREEFRRSGSQSQVADSVTFLSAVYLKLGDMPTAWERMLESLRLFAETDSASGLARGLAMASIILFERDEPELAARAAGAVYELVRDKGVMLAPVRVLHLDDPAQTAVERLGADRAAELMADGAATPLPEIVAEVLAAPAPAQSVNAGAGLT